MSWTKSFTGSIEEAKTWIKDSVSDELEFFGIAEGFDAMKAEHNACFERGKGYMLSEIEYQEKSTDATGFVTCSYSGHGSTGVSQYSILCTSYTPEPSVKVKSVSAKMNATK